MTALLEQSDWSDSQTKWILNHACMLATDTRVRIGRFRKLMGGLSFKSARFVAVVCVLVRSASKTARKCLLRGEFFLFAFHAHLLELALFCFDCCGDFLLNLSGCLF